MYFQLKSGWCFVDRIYGIGSDIPDVGSVGLRDPRSDPRPHPPHRAPRFFIFMCSFGTPSPESGRQRTKMRQNRVKNKVKLGVPESEVTDFDGSKTSPQHWFWSDERGRQDSFRHQNNWIRSGRRIGLEKWMTLDELSRYIAEKEMTFHWSVIEIVTVVSTHTNSQAI